MQNRLYLHGCTNWKAKSMEYTFTIYYFGWKEWTQNTEHYSQSNKNILMAIVMVLSDDEKSSTHNNSITFAISLTWKLFAETVKKKVKNKRKIVYSNNKMI